MIDKRAAIEAAWVGMMGSVSGLGTLVAVVAFWQLFRFLLPGLAGTMVLAAFVIGAAFYAWRVWGKMKRQKRKEYCYENTFRRGFSYVPPECQEFFAEWEAEHATG